MVCQYVQNMGTERPSHSHCETIEARINIRGLILLSGGCTGGCEAGSHVEERYWDNGATNA